MKALMISVICAALSISSFAQDKSSENKSSELSDSLNQFTSNMMSEEDRALAKKWKLKDSDWLKYKDIMEGPRGIWSPGLDPLTALGVSETDPLERKRYAELWIEMESKRYELEIAFEVERMKAAKRIFGDQKVIDDTQILAEWKRKQDHIKDLGILFVDVTCKVECKDYMDDIKDSMGNKTKLDIYFKEGALAEEIGEWATFMQLNREDVKARRITLNFDDGKSASMNVDMSKLPKTFLVDMDSGKIVYERD